MVDCNKNCIANVRGKCAVEKCGGPIVRVAHHYEAKSPEAGAKVYLMSAEAFRQYFGEEGGETDA